MVLIARPPLHFHLFVLSQMLGYIFFVVVVATESKYESHVIYGWVVTGCALLETLVLIKGYPGHGPSGTFLKGNPIYAGLLMAAAFSFLSSFSLSNECQGVKKLLAGLLAVSLGLALLLTQSRAAILGTYTASFLFLPKKWRLRFLLLSAGIIIGARGFKPAFFSELIKVNPDNYAFTFGRLVIWKAAFQALRDRFFFGYGLGNFETAYYHHQQPVGPILFFAHTTKFAHNDYLQLAVEAGVPALFIFFVGAMKCIAKVAHAPSSQIWLHKWALSVVVVFLISSLFSFTLFLPLTGLLVSGCVGILLSGGKKNTEPIAPAQQELVFFGCILLLVNMFLISTGLSELAESRDKMEMATKIMPIKSDLWYALAMREIQSSSPATANPTQKEKIIQHVKMALKWDSEDAFAWSRLGRVLSTVSPLPKSEAIFAFEKAKQWAPFHAPFWLEDGFFNLEINNVAEAKRNFRRALSLEPNTPLPFYGLGLTCLRERKIQQASALFKKALLLKNTNGYLTSGDQTKSAYTDYLFSLDALQVQLLLERLKKPAVL